MRVLFAFAVVFMLTGCMSLQMVNGNTIDLQLTIPVSLLP